MAPGASSNFQEVELKELEHQEVVLDALGWDVRTLWMQVRVGLVVGPVEWVQVVQVVQMLPDREPPQPPEPLEPTDSVEAAPRISSQSPWH